MTLSGREEHCGTALIGWASGKSCEIVRFDRTTARGGFDMDCRT